MNFMPSLIGKIEPGDVIGRCQIIRELGRGGVGTVYLATHQTLQIEVALKILSPSLSLDNPALAERFIREAQLAARIRHPNVIAVMDAAHDEATGLYFIVLEYVGGGSLSWHLRHGPLPEAKALAIITGIAHALVIAEENRIVHRDIKPDNIMLDLRGTAKLADLGLAKHNIDSRTSLTLGGSYMGTPAYMSPEQARDAKAADTRDDIYSLGATLYECLTGEAPFRGETPYNIMSELLTKPSPQPRLQRPEVSRSMDLICRKMMAKTRDLRYADANALLKDLQQTQIFGDSGLEKLEAATFNQDSIIARQQALNLGVETSADGVAMVPEPPDDSYVGPIHKPTPALIAPRRADYGVFGAAAALVILVMMATLLLAWLGQHHSLSRLKNEFALVLNPSTHASTAPPKPTAEQEPPPASPENPPPDPAPKIPSETAQTAPQPTVAPDVPVATPANTSEVTNAVPALPVNPETSPEPTLSEPASAFTARNIAESSLGKIDADPAGQPELLRIVGKRDDSPAVTPTTWTFYFYDTKTISNARIVSVKDGRVVKNGADIWHPLSPFRQNDVIPNDKIVVDSTQALQIAQNLISGVEVSNSYFELTQKDSDSVPSWKVTLWARDHEGEELELGSVTILAENGAVSSNTLKPERLAKH